MSYCVQGEQLLEVAKKGDAVAVERLLKNNDVVNYKDMVWGATEYYQIITCTYIHQLVNSTYFSCLSLYPCPCSPDSSLSVSL